MRDADAKAQRTQVASHKLSLSRQSKQQLLDKHAGLTAKLCDGCRKIFLDHYGMASYAEDIAKIDAA